MWRIHRLISRFRSLFTGQGVDLELNHEIEDHLQLLTERFVRQGMSPEEAAYAARRQFGGVTQLRDYHRETRGLPWIANLWRDLLFGLRLFHKRLGFSLIAIAVLALGIGANTAVYSVAKAVVFAPLPFPKPDRLALIFESDVGELRFQPGKRNLVSVRPGTFQDWREQSRSFQTMAAVHDTQAIIMDGDRASVSTGYLVGDGFFQTLAVPALLGRHFIGSDYVPGAGRIVVISHRMWRERYRADASIIGRNIVIDGAAHRVIGVMPAGFLPTAYYGRDPQFWLLLRWEPATRYSFVLWGYTVYARLKDGVTLDQAQGEMAALAARMRTAHPGDFGGDIIVAPLNAYLFANHERLFALLLVAVGLVLVIASANVANLLLARTLERHREFAIRSAIGASRSVILRQVLVESLIIAIAGGLLGAALSPLLMRPLLPLLATGNLPRLDQVRVDTGVLMFTMSISLLCGLLFGVFPAVRAGRGDLSLSLRAGGRGSSLARSERYVSDALMIGEIAFSMVLLVGPACSHVHFSSFSKRIPAFAPRKPSLFSSPFQPTAMEHTKTVARIFRDRISISA